MILLFYYDAATRFSDETYFILKYIYKWIIIKWSCFIHYHFI